MLYGTVLSTKSWGCSVYLNIAKPLSLSLSMRD